MDENYEIKYSPLCRKIERDGKVVEIQIYYSDEDPPKKSGWVLEIEDKHWNSTIYDDLFESDQEALDQILNDIEEDGIDAFIGKPGFFSRANAGKKSGCLFKFL